MRIVYLRALMNIFKTIIRRIQLGDTYILHAILTAHEGLRTIEILNVKFEKFMERTTQDQEKLQEQTN